MIIIEITENNFEEEIYQSSVPVLLDFYSEDCIACERMDRELEFLSNNYENNIKIAKINIDEHRELASACEIHCTPTLMFFTEGEVVDIIEGFKNYNILQEHIEGLL